jgi:uncharacterized protein YkwD
MTRLPTAPLFAIALSALAVAPVLTPGAAFAQDFDPAGEQSMLVRINAMRASQSLAPLVRDRGLDGAARTHCADMASEGALSHVSETTGTPADRVRNAGVSATTIAENVALHRSTDEAHQALLASDAHRANMLGPDIDHVGLAALRTERGVFVTQVFAAIAPAPPPPVAEAPPAPLAPAIVPPAPAVVAPPPAAPPPPVLAEPSSPPPDGPPAPRVEQGPLATPLPPPNGSVTPPVGALEEQVGSNGTVVLNREAPAGRVQGYWVYASGRWWYYPLPPGARAGQQLQHDPRVQSPPPGYPAHPFGPPQAQAQRAPMPQPMRQPMPQPMPQAWGVAPLGPGGVTIQPYAGQGSITIAPGTAFYAVPPPPMVGGRPTRAWRRAQRSWERAYQRWQRSQPRGDRPL